jgi:hypothetical protein
VMAAMPREFIGTAALIARQRIVIKTWAVQTAKVTFRQLYSYACTAMFLFCSRTRKADLLTHTLMHAKHSGTFSKPLKDVAGTLWAKVERSPTIGNLPPHSNAQKPNEEI